MYTKLAGCCLLVFAFGGSALAQAPAPPKPGPEHKLIGFFGGKWTTEGELKPGPLGPGGKVSSTDSCEWFTGGFQMVCRSDGKGPMGSMVSMGTMSYNAGEKVYQYYAIDNLGTAEMSKGTKKGNTWTFSATSSFGGQTFQSRYTLVETSPTAYTFKWESSPDGKQWSLLMDGKSTKTSK